MISRALTIWKYYGGLFHACHCHEVEIWQKIDFLSCTISNSMCHKVKSCKKLQYIAFHSNNFSCFCDLKTHLLGYLVLVKWKTKGDWPILIFKYIHTILMFFKRASNFCNKIFLFIPPACNSAENYTTRKCVRSNGVYRKLLRRQVIHSTTPFHSQYATLMNFLLFV